MAVFASPPPSKPDLCFLAATDRHSTRTQPDQTYSFRFGAVDLIARSCLVCWTFVSRRFDPADLYFLAFLFDFRRSERLLDLA